MPRHVEPGVGEGRGPEERADQVVGLEADHRGDARRAVPVLERPPSGHGHRHQPGVGVEGVGVADGEQERQVEDAVGVGVGRGRGRCHGRPPTGRRRPACRAPRRTRPRAGRCTGRPPRRSGWRSTSSKPSASARGATRSIGEVVASTDGQALGPVGLQRLEGPGLDQVDQGLHRPLARPSGGLGRAAPHVSGRGPGQTDGGDRLPEPVVEAVQEALAGEVTALRQYPLRHHGLWSTGPLADRSRVRSRSTKTAAGGCGHAHTLPPVHTGREPAHRKDPRPGRGKGTARGGRRSLRTDSTR